MLRFRLLKLGLAAWLCFAYASSSTAQDFRLGVGSAFAGNSPEAKNALFVVRVEGCAEPSKARLTATAEGIVSGTRQSIPLTLNQLPTPGVYSVLRRWSEGGVWVVNLTGTCQQRIAGAVIPIGPAGFLRDPSKFYPRPATPAEIDASLQALATSGGVR